MTILFFVYFGTHNNKIHIIINKPVFLFSVFPCCCFAFISKQQQQKNHHFIYDLSMLWCGLGSVISAEPQNTVYSAEQEAIIKAIQVSGAKKDGG
jgi:hypothetical protein